jgi:hypothetical protein
MKTSTRSGSAAVLTMVLSVLSLVVIATVMAKVRGETLTYSSHAHPTGDYYCDGADLVITSVVPHTNGTGTNREFTVYIKNIGSAAAVLDYPKIAGWRAYLSNDGISKDIHVQGNNFSGILAIGQTTSSTAAVQTDLDSYPPYLIVELYVLSNVGECNTSNNSFLFPFRQ